MNFVTSTFLLTLQAHFRSSLPALFFLLIISAQAQPGGQSGQAGSSQQQRHNAVAALLLKTTVPSTFHDVKSTEPVTLSGRQGTIVNIPASAFVNANGIPVTGLVQIEMKEVFTRSEMLLSNLPTISNGKLLESGGVVYLDAKTMDGEEVSVAPGKSISIQFPSGPPAAGMQAFAGNYDAAGNMNWIAMDESNQEIPDGQSGNLVNPATLMFADGKRTVQSYLYSILEKKTSCTGNDKVWIEVAIAPDGTTRKVRTSGYNSCYYKSVLDIIHHLRWNTAAAPEMSTVSFTISPENYSNEVNPRNGVYAEVASAGDWMALYDEKFDQYASKIQAGEVAMNTLQVAQLGWINCDRFYDVNPKVNLIVSVEGGMEKEFAKVFVIFKDIKSVVGGSQVDYSSHEFANLPGGMKAYAVAISYLDNQPYFGVKEISVGEAQVAVAITKTTLDDLKNKMETMN